MKWAGKSVLVTGAGGFIGSHLAEALVRRGARVKAFVHYNALGSWGWLDWSPFRKDMEVAAGDICDSNAVFQAMKGVDIVFHLAALIGIPYSYHSPESYVRTNIGGTLNVLQAARQLKPKRIVFTSTSEVYGSARYVPIDEDHSLQGQSPYAASKIGADKLVEAFHCSYHLPVVTLRPFNTFGPRQSARAVIPTIVTQGLNGKTIQLGNLRPVRDWTYVSDVVEAFLLAGVSPKVVGRTINIGSGNSMGIAQLVELISKLMRKKLLVKKNPARVRPAKSEVERLKADNVLARQLLGWRPHHSLEEGLRLTIHWIRKNLEKYKNNGYTL